MTTSQPEQTSRTDAGALTCAEQITAEQASRAVPAAYGVGCRDAETPALVDVSAVVRETSEAAGPVVGAPVDAGDAASLVLAAYRLACGPLAEERPKPPLTHSSAGLNGDATMGLDKATPSSGVAAAPHPGRRDRYSWEGLAGYVPLSVRAASVHGVTSWDAWERVRAEKDEATPDDLAIALWEALAWALETDERIRAL